MGHVLAAFLEPPHEEPDIVLRMQHPQKIDEKCIEEENDRFLLDHPIFSRIVLKLESFHCECHDGSCEEHAECVLESIGKLHLGSGLMFLKIAYFVEDGLHDELVEQLHAQDCYEDNKLS